MTAGTPREGDGLSMAAEGCNSDDAQPRRRRPRWPLAAAVLAAAYCGGYLHLRQRHWFVHYSTAAYGNTYSHRVDMGDLWFAPPPVGVITAFYLYAPLRWLETGYWYARYPRNRPWPYFEPARQPREGKWSASDIPLGRRRRRL